MAGSAYQPAGLTIDGELKNIHRVTHQLKKYFIELKNDEVEIYSKSF
jgi:hypothetical protein